MMNTRKRLTAGVVAVALAWGGTGAPAFAEPVDNPLTRSFYWFRFVAGKDIRDACGQAGPDRYRLVFNAIYREQVRAYDVVVDPGGGGAMTTRVFGEVALNSIVVSDLSDVLGPWRGVRVERPLAPAESRNLVSAMEASGALRFPERTIQVPSNDFYWVVSACRAGQFTATAFHHPTDGFRAVQFDKVLFALDNTGVAVNAARQVTPSAFRGDPNQIWRLRVTPGGIEY